MRSPKGRAIAAGMIGNVLEWYDFAIYGYFAASIGRHFFPREDPVAQLLAAFGVFALGYLVRPVGGALIGHIGDRYGRRNALTVSVAAMAVPTFLMGLLPGYDTLGILAPIALVLLRMVQGLSVGGEYTSSMVFMVERAPAGQRGLMGALTASGTTLGILMGSGVGAVTAAAMSTEALDAWGWRIPFLLGILVGIAGFFLRGHGPDDPIKVGSARSPLLETMRHHWRLVAQLAGLSAFNGVSFYVMFVYVASWLQTADGISPAHALRSTPSA
jgi:MHS family proline/betaine transporter-like MFS transporter